MDRRGTDKHGQRSERPGSHQIAHGIPVKLRISKQCPNGLFITSCRAPEAVLLSNLPVMMVTAFGGHERRRLAGKYGAAEFITKPVDFDLLKSQLRDLSDNAD